MLIMKHGGVLVTAGMKQVLFIWPSLEMPGK